MALYFIGEHLGKLRGHRAAESGKLVQLFRGVYVDAEDDAEATVLTHAVRIAKYLYPRAYLSGASAALLGPTRDGRLFLTGRRSQRTRIRSLEIIQNEAPAHPSIGEAVIDDGMGEFHVNVSSMRQRFLEAFRIRTEHAAAIDEGMRGTIADRLIEEYLTPQAAAEAVRALARENKWVREGDLAERFLLRPETEPSKNLAELNLVVAWHGAPIGRLVHDGFEWRWIANESGGPSLVRQTMPGKLPPFIVSLLPEGWLEKVLKDQDERTLLRSGKRYMSNISIVERESDLARLPPDLLLTKLQRYVRNGVFIGRYAGPGRDHIEKDFERALAKIYENAETPRLSGVQIKAPMCLGGDGTLSASTGKPFTHILKPAGTSGFEALPIVEWLCMELGRAAGFLVPTTALVAMPDGMPPALLVERFDIRDSEHDRRMLALEDMCSVLDLSPDAKYSATMERVAKAVRSLSTAPEEDNFRIFERAVFAWVIADGDMHLKNMSLLKVTEPREQKFLSVRVAPLYDAVTTRLFPGLEHDRMALKLAGKDDKLDRAAFRTFADTIGLKTAEADLAIDTMVERLADAIARISLPPDLNYGERSENLARELLDICRGRITSLR